MKNSFKLTGLVFLILTVILHSCKKEELPTLSTTAITNITATSATSGGNITSDGGAEVTARGVCWGENANPTISDSKTNDGNGTGQFVSNLSGLAAGSTYHVRAYATNSVGTAYGADMLFATLGQVPEAITQSACCIRNNGATLNGTVNANYLSTTVTFEYGTTTAYGSSITGIPGLVTGNNSTSVSGGISGLSSGTTYHFRIKAVNSLGTSYGDNMTFTTLSIPTLSTTAITGITFNSAHSGGNITFDGGTAIIIRGVCWSTDANPTTALSTKTTDGTGTGSFISDITGLTPGTLYHVRAYATNSEGTSYGDQLSFNTLIAIPTVTTTSLSSITKSSAKSGGNVTSTGGSSVNARGICWSTSQNPTIDNFRTTDGSGTGAFISTIDGLSYNTTYYVRAYATNSYGIAYGNQLDFKTLEVDKWVQKASLPAEGRHGAASFTIGEKGYICTGGTYIYSEVWEYNAATDTWAQKADFGGQPRSNAAGVAINGKGYVGMGISIFGGFHYCKDFWEYDPILNNWTRKIDFPGVGGGDIAAFSIADKGYFGCGYYLELRYTNEFWQYDPTLNSWTRKGDFPGGKRTGLSTFTISGEGYFALGEGEMDLRNDIWEYNSLDDSWIKKADFPGTKRTGASGFAIDNFGYICCGGSTLIDLWSFDPLTDSWTRCLDFPGTPRGGGSALVINKKGYFGLGSKGEVKFNDWWEYTPSK